MASKVVKLQTFLKKHKLQTTKRNDNEHRPITHTRMGDTTHNIIPGSYSIPDEQMETFYKLLYNEVIQKNGKEYLTETQLKEDGGKNRCIAIDFDFNYELGTLRQHSKEDVFNIICCILEQLKKIFDFTSNTDSFKVYAFERKQAYDCDRKKCSKDGIHIIIGIKADTIQQTILRDMVMEELQDIIRKLPLINKPSDVYDNSITAGTTNWQLYGCRKPGKEPYLLSFYYNIEWNFEDCDFESDFVEGSEFPMQEQLKLLSIRNNNIPLFAMTDECDRIYQAKINKNTNKSDTSYTLKVRNVDFRYTSINPDQIKNHDDLIKAHDMLYESLSEETDVRYGHMKSKFKEISDVTMILPSEFYDDFDKWLRVGWALFNTSKNDYMFYTWMLFSSQSDKFDYNDIPLYYSDKYWGGFQSAQGKGFTAGSIIYWAREYWNKTAKSDDENKYLKIKNQTLDYFLEQSTDNPTDFDIAKVLYHYCRDKFICGDVKNSRWFEFRNHKFIESDSGVNLSLIISSNLHQLYHDRMMQKSQSIKNMMEDEQTWKDTKIKLKSLALLCMRVRDVGKKDKIMKAAKELFYDEKFSHKIDKNPKLLGCNNGVVDFDKNVFRPGDTVDYITKSTNNNYIPSESIPLKIKNEINEFMRTLFPIPELEQYMWEMLASCLVGNNKNQTFHIFTGGGSNGKSLLMKLMKYVLGEYYGIVPLSVVTEKRPRIGGVSPEIANLIGTRLAVINEPSKGEKINEGPMKALTGGDDIQARGLFKDSVTFTPSFKLAVCTNVLFDIDATDDGTWRRIKICPFLSHFTEEPDSTKEFEFVKDLDLEDKMLDNWVEAFLSMLVDVAFRTGGVVKSKCEIVDAKSKEYRNNQDHIINFIEERIKSTPGERVKKMELSREFEDWFKMNYGKRNAPKMKEIYPVMDKRFGKYINGWPNISIINEEAEDEAC
jgi:P4 family phage/plasmid primase-like protien